MISLLVPGKIKEVYEADDWVSAIVKEDGKQGLYGLKK